MILRRRYLTLIEVLIAMALSAVLISITAYFYQQLSIVNLKMDKAQNEHFQRRYVEYRLNATLPQAVAPSNKDFHFFLTTNSEGNFLENSPSLVFTFDNCVKLNRDMTDLVIGRLYLDKEKRLTLAIWPIPKRWKENEQPPMSKEVIMENVEKLSFEFYTPPDKGQLKLSNKQESKTTSTVSQPGFPNEIKGVFHSDWKKEYRQLPAIVKVNIERKVNDKVDNLTFSYHLPNTQQPIIYTQ